MTNAVQLGGNGAPRRRITTAQAVAPKPEASVTAEGHGGDPETDASTEEQTTAATQVTDADPAPRKRGRPRKDPNAPVVPRARRVQAAEAGAPAVAKAKPGRKPKVQADVDHKALGELVVAAKRAGVSIEAYVNRMRSQVTAFDALNG